MKERNPNWLRIDPKEPIAVACWKGVLSKMTYQEFLDDIGAKTSPRLEALWEDAEETVKNLGPNEWADLPWEYPDPDRYPSLTEADEKLQTEFLKKMGEK
jgi:hypothetical protein